MYTEGEYDAAIAILDTLAVRPEGSLDSGEQDYLDTMLTIAGTVVVLWALGVFPKFAKSKSDSARQSQSEAPKLRYPRFPGEA
jgi:hypothetical protein